jgi:hypothetical protein
MCRFSRFFKLSKIDHPMIGGCDLVGNMRARPVMQIQIYSARPEFTEQTDHARNDRPSRQTTMPPPFADEKGGGLGPPPFGRLG